MQSMTEAEADKRRNSPQATPEAVAPHTGWCDRAYPTNEIRFQRFYLDHARSCRNPNCHSNFHGFAPFCSCWSPECLCRIRGNSLDDNHLKSGKAVAQQIGVGLR
jgi:hypothetical protein